MSRQRRTTPIFVGFSRYGFRLMFTAGCSGHAWKWQPDCEHCLAAKEHNEAAQAVNREDACIADKRLYLNINPDPRLVEL